MNGEYRSTTEHAAEARARLAKWMAWRERAWGYASMSPREYECLCIEQRLRYETRGLSRVQLMRYTDAYLSLTDPERRSAIYRVDADKLAAAKHAIECEQQALEQTERGVQTRVAQEMEVSRVTVCRLLARAGYVLQYFADQEGDAYGWQRGTDGLWYLHVPVAPIDPYTRRKWVRVTHPIAC